MEKARTREDDLAAMYHWPGGLQITRLGLFLGGMPYTTDISPIERLLVSWGYGMVQPQYLGTFDSGDTFTPTSALDTVSVLAGQLEKGTVKDLRGERDISVPTHIPLAAAHSFGTNVLVRALVGGFRPEKVILLSPFFEFGAGRAHAGAIVDLERHLRHMRAALPHTFRMDNTGMEWDEYFLFGSQWDDVIPSKVNSGPVDTLCIVGGSDPSINTEAAETYARKFEQRFPSVLSLREFIVVKNAGHDQSELLTMDTRKAIRSFIECP